MLTTTQLIVMGLVLTALAIIAAAWRYSTGPAPETIGPRKHNGGEELDLSYDPTGHQPDPTAVDEELGADPEDSNGTTDNPQEAPGATFIEELDLSTRTQNKLHDADYLVAETLRQKAEEGTLKDIHGIGPARAAEIRSAVLPDENLEEQPV